jgi:hypothetical protein
MYHDFSGNPENVDRANAMLTDGEQLIAIVDTEQRVISVTSERVILHEKRSGGYSVIRNSQISAIEVSNAEGEQKFVKILFGGSYERMVGAPDAAQAAVIAGAASCG